MRPHAPGATATPFQRGTGVVRLPRSIRSQAFPLAATPSTAARHGATPTWRSAQPALCAILRLSGGDMSGLESRCSLFVGADALRGASKLRRTC